MNLQQLRYFVTVAQFEHYSRAAKALYITQSALSNSMNRLETELGVELFEHVGRNVVLTPQGRQFLLHVSIALGELDFAIKELADFSTESSSTIRIGSVAALMRGFLASLLSAYNEKALGKLNFDISQKGSTKECVACLRSGELDVAFCGYPVQESNLEWKPLCPEDAVVAVSVNHPLAQRDQVSILELRDYPQVSYREPSYMHYAFQNMFTHYGLEPKQAFEDEISALSVIASNEESVGIMLDTIRDVTWESLKLIHISEFERPYHWVGLTYRTDIAYPPMIADFIAHVVEVSDSTPYQPPIERDFYR